MAKQKTITVKINGVSLEVNGWYSPYKAGNREYPPEDEEFEIVTVFYNLTDITPVLEDVVDDFDWYELEKLCLGEIK